MNARLFLSQKEDGGKLTCFKLDDAALVPFFLTGFWRLFSHPGGL